MGRGERRAGGGTNVLDLLGRQAAGAELPVERALELLVCIPRQPLSAPAGCMQSAISSHRSATKNILFMALSAVVSQSVSVGRDAVIGGARLLLAAHAA